MPKLGRRSEIAELEYRWAGSIMSSRNAPFGTGDTPTARMKIVGGKPIYIQENGRSPSPQVSQRSSPTRHLIPITQKPNEVDPTPYVHSPRAAQFGFGSAHKDIHNSHIHPPVSRESSDLNPHKIIPPISHSKDSTDKYVIKHETAVEQVDLQKYLPQDTYLPKEAIKLGRKEELELRRRLRDEMEGFNVKQLKDTYVQMAGFDSQLSGDIPFQDLSFTLMRRKMHVSADLLRLVASMFVTQPGKVNYEKVLSFLASSLEDPSPSVPEEQSSHRVPSVASGPAGSPRAGMHYNPLTHKEEDFSASSEKFPFGERDNAKLLRLVQTQLANSGDEIDLNRVHQTFQALDRGQRGMLSESQIKQAAYTCRIPLQESIINQIISRCDSSNGQYRWQQFVAFIERVQPSVTGLPIPVSKRPLEYAKVYPEPSSDWPRMPAEQGDTAWAAPSKGSRPGDAGAPGAATPQSQVSQVTAQAEQSLPRTPNSPGHQPLQDVDPNDDLALGHPRMERLSQIEGSLQKHARVEQLEKELKMMEHEYEVERSKMMAEEERLKKQKLVPWLDRFMKLANAMYGLDTPNTGYLSQKEASWLAEQYNMNYDLGLSNPAIHNAMRQAQEGNRVAIDAFLRIISMQGP